MRYLFALFALWLTSAALAAPPLPETPVDVKGVVYARAFELSESFQYDWRRERPSFDRGVLLVLEVDPDLVYPRQTAEPVLYVGDQTAMRLNVGYRSGYLVVLVPGALSLSEDLAIWFGSPALPEQVDAATIADQRSLAAQRGIAAHSNVELTDALNRAEDALRADSLDAVFAAAAKLVEAYSPQEVDRASALARQAR